MLDEKQVILNLSFTLEISFGTGVTRTFMTREMVARNGKLKGTGGLILIQFLGAKQTLPFANLAV